ncbi:3-methyl-2-oxobutanoate hydroxymethyltransferase [Parvularcula bermudensis HTCC2503]|uniref:3-methyl-2-oxobutanoate hydroxymethyltransferase n=1 Tax=Parvularcula bermudensis (strain ATCC BAA-594 / HTCC2503 / KCTC 12087) TaxID=314260 RepID=E0TIB4_PARBH|nr:TerB family tellurite resistance protein [Parvularcula bermudensis]ADM09698.1 3-methyl-2-oxobutanoate hydroxymethyltransferase [Parvularcula bermudensis HTCC2503]
MLKWLSQKLSVDAALPLSAASCVEVQAATLLVEAARRDGAYSEVDRETVTASLMKLFYLSRIEADALRREAERRRTLDWQDAFAADLTVLDSDRRERLVRLLWEIVDVQGLGCAAGEDLVFSVGDRLTLTPERISALRAVAGTAGRA